MAKRKTTRRESDFYPTPPDLAQAAVKLLPALPAAPRILDPGAGAGIWGSAVKKLYPQARITGVDIRQLDQPDGYTRWHIGDYLKLPYFVAGNQDLVIGNPPFSQAEGFVRQALAHTRDGGYVCYLLRLTFLESKARLPLFLTHPPRNVWILPSRVSFLENGGSDFTTCAIFLWQKGYQGNTLMHWFDWQASAQSQEGAA